MRRILPAAIVSCILLLFLTATALDTTIEGQINTSINAAEDVGNVLNGTSTHSCEDISQCLPCNCNVEGSISQQCDSNGTCKCKPSFYGLKCSNRNCALSSWNSWSSCSKSCGYGGSRYQRRHVRLTRRGDGTLCSDPIEKKESCFNRCCHDQFHCSRRKTCIPRNYKCNYDNDCGDGEDEEGCSESCRDRYTSYRDQHYEFSVVCHEDEVMKGFQLQRSSDGKIRYKYRCCNINRNGLWKFGSHTHYSAPVLRGYEYPSIDCSSNNFVRGFDYLYYDRGWWKAKGMSFVVYFWDVYTDRVDSYSGVSNWGYSRDMKSLRDVMCRDRYFLNNFRFQKRNGRIRYSYSCKKISL